MRGFLPNASKNRYLRVFCQLELRAGTEKCLDQADEVTREQIGS